MNEWTKVGKGPEVAGIPSAVQPWGRLFTPSRFGDDLSHGPWASLEGARAGQDAKGQAEAGAEIFAQLRDGTDPADIEDVFIPFQIVTAENVDDYLAGGAETEA